jgi:uncharacterized protein YaaR (DUF327 family)
MQITGARSTGIRPQNSRVIIVRNASPSPFSRELAKKEETIRDLDRWELEEIKEELQDMGASFEKEPSLANFRVFRELIGRFAKKAVSLAYRIERLKGDRPGCIHEIIAIIDRNADELYRLVMDEQRDRLCLARRIANINGMIVRITA